MIRKDLDANYRREEPRATHLGSTYAIGLALAHLLNVGSPYAIIFLLLPNSATALSSTFT